VRPVAAAVCWLALAGGLAACGSDDDGGGGGDAPRAGPEGARLSVIVRPEGPDGPSERRRVQCERLGEGSADCRRLAGLTVRRLAPVSPETACAEIYGGPAEARVHGELRGEPVDARFSRVNACEIERWDRNMALLGRPSSEPVP
jgi:hypothetical protein